MWRDMKPSRVLVLFLNVAFWAPGKANAFCIGWDKSIPNYDPKYYSVSHEFKRAKYDMSARVIREIWLGEDGKETELKPPFLNGGSSPLGFDPYLGAYYHVQVKRKFKGRPEPRLRLFSENTTARFWLAVGAEYLLFVTDDSFDVIGKQLTVDTCGNSVLIKNAESALRLVENLSNAK
jgi:hypothetical protein